MAMDLWYAPGQALAVPANAGLSRSLALLARAAAAHPDVVWMMDTSGFADFQRGRLFLRHARQCGAWGYTLAQVFGELPHPGAHAGLGVPLLSVRFWERAVPCVAPHWDLTSPDGGLRSILDFLGMLAPAEQARLFGECARGTR